MTGVELVTVGVVAIIAGAVGALAGGGTLITFPVLLAVGVPPVAATAMQIESQPTTHFGPEYCNTQVTTLIAGQLYAHVFFSTVWPDFPGYSLIQIWPPTYPYIDTGLLPAMSDRDGVMLHETISRLGKRAV